MDAPPYRTFFLAEKVERKVDKYALNEKGNLVPIGGLMLPLGSTRTDRDGITEVFIPPASRPLSDESVLLDVATTMPEWTHEVFAGIKRLNRIQSVVYEAAFNSSANFLVSAPTGAGKTNVALLAILQALRHDIEKIGRTPFATEFKIVYVAPLKSLVTEITQKFTARLKCLGLRVGEFTGDTNPPRSELDRVHVMVTVPEKWDILTRNITPSILDSVKLLVLDEIHLVGEDRGAVLEAIVARSFTHMHASQRNHRIVALSATLPNWKDIGLWLDMRPEHTFRFGAEVRPVPLSQTVLGVHERDRMRSKEKMMDITFHRANLALRRDQQVMIFVHSRNETVKTAQEFLSLAQKRGSPLLQGDDKRRTKETKSIQDRELNALAQNGICCHHAGVTRHDRKLIEKLFADGVLRVLCSTATLAWGVNLPAHLVLIKGTQLYNAEKGGYVDLDILDVLQIFGRAGRPDFDDHGEAVLITEGHNVDTYTQRLLAQMPLESKFLKALPDHLNAEISLGTVFNDSSASNWFRHTFAFVRMRANPGQYGISRAELRDDPTLNDCRIRLVRQAARILRQAHLIRLGGDAMSATTMGRIATKFYVSYQTLMAYNQVLDSKSVITDSDVLDTVARSSEFGNLKVRDEEIEDMILSRYRRVARVKPPPKTLNDPDSPATKVLLLIQMWLDRIVPEVSALVADMLFVIQSFGRLLRAFAELALSRSLKVSSAALTILEWSKVIERRVWKNSLAIEHFCVAADTKAHLQLGEGPAGALKRNTLKKLDGFSESEIRRMTVGELASVLRVPAEAKLVSTYMKRVPHIEMRAMIQPISYSVLKVSVYLLPLFEWSDKYSGAAEPFKVILEDPVSHSILHQEDFILTRDAVKEVPKYFYQSDANYTLLDRRHDESEFELLITFAVPVHEPRPPQYVLQLVSMRWVGINFSHVFELEHLLLPHTQGAQTELLPLQPIPVQALRDRNFEKLYKFQFFNPVQSQTFHTLYHTDLNALVGAPTGSGKTICAEFAILRQFRNRPKSKIIYIAPLKALAKERLADWVPKFRAIGKKVVEVSGDYTPDMKAMESSDLYITTPEKWDGLSRQWQNRTYLHKIGLVIMDEIHLLGSDRGPILEIIVSRMRYISAMCNIDLRLLGLSTALANAGDIADWLAVSRKGLFNFKPAVRPVPCTVYVAGFPTKAYCPRMASMNKPAFQQIQEHSPDKPVLIFVASRRQTRITAKEMAFLAKLNTPPVSFLNLEAQGLTFEDYTANVLNKVRDNELREALSQGVGMHHAGLCPEDRQICQNLFSEGTIQLLVATSTLAWGVNLPARLVILKGTEFYDAKTCKYVDMPLTDVLQMVGRAGRPQFDDQASACIFIHEPKKQFYRKFLYEAFPVESSLAQTLTDHLNAEIVNGSIRSKMEAIRFLSWTYFFRRICSNPSFYNTEIQTGFEISLGSQNNRDMILKRNTELGQHLSELLDASVTKLVQAGCIQVKELNIDQAQNEFERLKLFKTELGKISSLYYISHQTIKKFGTELGKAGKMSILDILNLVCDAYEIGFLPVRHCEDDHNLEWSRELPWRIDVNRITTGHVKASCLLQMRLFNMTPPIVDYHIDLNQLLASSVRMYQACADVAREKGNLSGLRSTLQLVQLLCQGTHPHKNLLRTLPHMKNNRLLKVFFQFDVVVPSQLLYIRNPSLLRENLLHAGLTVAQWKEFLKAVDQLPRLTIDSIEFRANNKPVHFSTDEGAYILPRDASVDVRVSSTLMHGFHQRTQLNEHDKTQRNESAYTPGFPKGMRPNWWFWIGDENTDELITFRRCQALQNPADTHLQTLLRFKTPNVQNEQKFTLTLNVDSECYVSFCQQVCLPFMIARLLLCAHSQRRLICPSCYEGKCTEVSLLWCLDGAIVDISTIRQKSLPGDARGRDTMRKSPLVSRFKGPPDGEGAVLVFLITGKTLMNPSVRARDALKDAGNTPTVFC